jgi:hypothetical protein
VSDRQVTRPVSVETAPVAAGAKQSFPYGRTLVVGAVAAFLSLAALSMAFRAAMPSVAANSTLKCYDSAGNDEPCGTRASASAAPANGGTLDAHHPPGWMATALYRQATSATNVVDPPANSITNAPAPRIAGKTRRRLAQAICNRRMVPCFFSALRRGVTHFVSVAAAASQARPAREHL